MRSCPGRSAHGLRRLMRRPVVRMCGLSSTTTSRAPSTGTDVLICPPDSLLRASRSSGSASGTLRERSTTGTGKHVSVLGTSHRFLLADGPRREGLGIPSPHLGCQSRRRQRRHVQGWCCWFLPLRAVLLPVGARPRCLASWSVWTRRTVEQCTGFAGNYSPRSVFPSVDDRPKMHDIMAGVDQKCYVGAWLVCW